MTRTKKYTGKRSYEQQRGYRRTTQPRPTTTSGNEQPPKSLAATLSGLGLLAILILGFAFIVIMGHSRSTTVTASGGSSGKVPAGYGSLNHAKGPCGNTGQAVCPATQPDWFPVASESPSAVAVAITSSSEYLSMQAQYSYTAMDIPALVHAYSAHTGIAYYDNDHWVVSVRNAAGLRCGLFDFVYDRANHRLRFSSYGVITASDPHTHQAFPYISSAQAVSVLQSERKKGVRRGSQPELIFFPIDPNFPVLTSPVHKWAGGGNSPMNPMWSMVGTDGNSYFVGIDQHVHNQSELPITKGQP